MAYRTVEHELTPCGQSTIPNAPSLFVSRGIPDRSDVELIWVPSSPSIPRGLDAFRLASIYQRDRVLIEDGELAGAWARLERVVHIQAITCRFARNPHTVYAILRDSHSIVPRSSLSSSTMHETLTDLRGVGPEIFDIDGERGGMWSNSPGSLCRDLRRPRSGFPLSW